MSSFPCPTLTTADINAGDTAWMITSAALVLIMTPGLAFFYGGYVAFVSPHTFNSHFFLKSLFYFIVDI
jgi:ammonia channel protein AmtB